MGVYSVIFTFSDTYKEQAIMFTLNKLCQNYCEVIPALTSPSHLRAEGGQMVLKYVSIRA